VSIKKASFAGDTMSDPITTTRSGLTRIFARFGREPVPQRLWQGRRWHGCDTKLARFLTQRFAQGGND